MGARVEYKASVQQDLRKLDRGVARRALNKIEQALVAGQPAGVALAGEFAGLYRLRVGDWRIIYARTPDGYLVLRIGHRREIE